jgi:type II secretory ATPase GspE/PulE/Tfp pilus assembly ATPase PilB-like protein
MTTWPRRFHEGASTDVIRQMALESGMVTLLGYSLELVRQGHTTLEEGGTDDPDGLWIGI